MSPPHSQALAGKGSAVRVLVVNRNELHRCEGDAKTVIVLYNWGCAVIDWQGMHEYCHDLENLLADPDIGEHYLRAVRRWLERHPNKPSGARSG